MLKPYNEMRKIDVRPYCEQRDGYDYLNWAKCNDLMDLKQLSRDLDRAGYRFVVDRENFVIRITGVRMNQQEQEIINELTSMTGGQSMYTVFNDWIACASLAVCNRASRHDAAWSLREDLYSSILRRYPEGAEYKFASMFCLLAEALENEITDVLGHIYMISGMGSKITGQFFTPFHLSLMSARLRLLEDIKDYDGHEIQLYEPSVGGGGMIIAAAKVLKDAGINYQRKMKVVAQDLDWKGVYMTYLQCSLLGIKAMIVQGDTLSEPYDEKATDPQRIMRTPAWIGVLP